MGQCRACGEDLVAKPASETVSVYELCTFLLRRLRVPAFVALGIVLVAIPIVYVGRDRAGGLPVDALPSALRTRTRSTLVYSLDGLRLVDLDTGHSRTLTTPAPRGTASDGSVRRIGQFLLLNRGNTAWLYRPGLNHPPVDLGQSLRIIPASSPDHVWLWSADGVHVRMVDFSGRQVGSPRTMPDGWFPTGETTDEGLLLTQPLANTSEIWDPISNRVTRVVANGHALAGRGHLLAWAIDPCVDQCLLHLTDVATGAHHSLALPSSASFNGAALFSPDGSTLAVPVSLRSTSIPRDTITAMAIVDLRHWRIQLLALSQQHPTDPGYLAAWSPTGWLFFAANSAPNILAWRPGRGRATVVKGMALPVNPPADENAFLNAL